MKKPIDLENTSFSLAEFMPTEPRWPQTIAWSPKGRPQRMADFGTVFIGLEKVSDPNRLLELEDMAVGDGPVFVAPENWGWPQVARALGFFKSATQARKNGWNEEIQPGWNEKVGRINKVRGEIVVFKIDDLVT